MFFLDSPETVTAISDREQRTAFVRDADDGNASTSPSTPTLRRRATDRRGDDRTGFLAPVDPDVWTVTPSSEVHLPTSISISRGATADEPIVDRPRDLEHGGDSEKYDAASDSEDAWGASDPNIAVVSRQRLSLLAKRYAERLDHEESARLQILTSRLDVLAPVITEEFLNGVEALHALRARLDDDLSSILAGLE